MHIYPIQQALHMLYQEITELHIWNILPRLLQSLLHRQKEGTALLQMRDRNSHPYSCYFCFRQSKEPSPAELRL